MTELLPVVPREGVWEVARCARCQRLAQIVGVRQGIGGLQFLRVCVAHPDADLYQQIVAQDDLIKARA